jgi:hypothetical protein
MNLEQRPQQTYEIFTRFFDARPIKRVFSSLFSDLLFEKDFYNFKIEEDNTFYGFIYEITKHPLLFESLENIFTHIAYEDYFFVNYVYKYPTKSNLEDFYCSNK